SATSPRWTGREPTGPHRLRTPAPALHVRPGQPKLRVMEPPEIRYAQSGDVSIAYSVIGDGPFDVVFVSGWVLSNLAGAWEGTAAELYRGMADFCRLIIFDKRGTGLSDRVTGIPDLETRMDDVRAVMDAAGSRRAAVVGFSEGGPMSILFASSHPERTAAIVLYGSLPSWHKGNDTPGARPGRKCSLASSAPTRRSGPTPGSTTPWRGWLPPLRPTLKRCGCGAAGSGSAPAREPSRQCAG